VECAGHGRYAYCGCGGGGGDGGRGGGVVCASVWSVWVLRFGLLGDCIARRFQCSILGGLIYAKSL
jgi:hypothetical protein